MPSKFLTQLFPILCLLYSATLWGVIWYPLRLLENAGLQGVWATFILFFSSLVVGVIPALGRMKEILHHPWLLLLLGLANGWCNVSFILAVIDGNVVRVLLLFYLSPLWATLLGWFILNESISRFSLGILTLAMIGALTMLWDPALGYPWPQNQNDWLAISSGFAFAVSNVLVRLVQSVSLLGKTVVTWTGVAMVAILWIIVAHVPVPEISLPTLMGAVALGVFGMMFMTLALQYGVSHMPVHRSAVILLFELIAGAVSSLLLTNEVIQPREWLGGALIILTAYLSSRIHVGAKHEN